MKFKLTNTSAFPSPERAELLKQLGFVFQPFYGADSSLDGNPYLTEDPAEPVEIRDLAALLSFISRFGKPDYRGRTQAVITINPEAGGDPVLELYDDYRE